MEVGNRIRELRKRSGLSMKQLAEKVGVSYLTIYRIETGKVSPSVALLSEIAHHLNYPIFSFLNHKEHAVVRIPAEEQPIIESKKMELRLLAPKGLIDENISISFGKGKKGEFISRHKNRGSEVAYITRGKGILKYGDKDIECNEGDLIYFKGETPHAVVGLEPHEFILIRFIDK